MKKILICKTEDLLQTDCKQFIFKDENGAIQEGFVVQSGERISAFLNQCPHLGVQLNWQSDHFLEPDRKYIICAVHGALFQTEDGLCITGPCIRQKLKPLPVELIDKSVFLSCSKS